MTMDRRGFIKSLFAGSVAVALPVSAIQCVAPELFRLAGDGVHDDAPALQALINGDAVIGPSGDVLQGKMVGDTFTVYLPAGTFNIGSHSVVTGRHARHAVTLRAAT